MIREMTQEEYEKQFGVAPQTAGVVRKTAFAEPAPKPKKTIGQRTIDIADAVTNFVGARGIAEQFGSDIARAVAPKAQKGFVEYPSFKEVAGSALQTGSLLLPGGAAKAAAPKFAGVRFARGFGEATKAQKAVAAAKNVAAGVGTGYAMDVGSQLQEEDKGVSEAFTPGAATAVSVAIPFLGKIVGGFPKAMEQANLRMTPAERINLKRSGKDIAEYLARKKIVGNPEQRFAKVDSLYNKMEDNVGKIVARSNKTYKKQDVLDALKAVPEQFADDPAGYREAEGAMSRIVDFITQKAPDEIPAKLIQTYKRNLWKRAYSKNQADVVNESFHAAGSLFKDLLDKDIKGLGSLNDEYGKLLTARKILFKATERPQTGFADRTLGTIGGAALGSAAGPVGAGVGAIVGEKASKMLGNTTTRSAAGATVQTLQDILGRIPKDSAGNLQITEKSLMLLLQDALE